jgi:LmbE family N-acetylglucosaminyl deacetylase
VYVVAPVFGPGQRRYDLSPEEGAASHRIEITAVAGRKLAALACHASQADTAEEIAELRAALDREGAVYEGYTRVRPTVPAARPTFFSRLV